METNSNLQRQPDQYHHHPPVEKSKINHPMEEEQHHPSPVSPDKELIFPNLPQDLLVEILSRLPVKSLVKFMCVSRIWLSLISDPHFIRTHLKISSNKDDSRHYGLIVSIISLAPDPYCHLKQCSLDSALDVKATAIEVTDIDYPMKNPIKSVCVVDSCDGLVCIASGENDLFLWNPSVRKSKKLPDFGVELEHDCYLKYGFGYDNLNDDYKVVILFMFCRYINVFETQVRVYSLESDSWRRIEDFKGGVPSDDLGKYANGKLHWSAFCRSDSIHNWNIVSLDLGNETYGEVELPEYGEGVCGWTVGVSGGCLLVLCHYERTMDVWVMKEYGVRNSWSKVVHVPYLDDPGECRYFVPVCLSRNGEFLFVYYSRLVLYNPKSGTFTYLQINGPGVDIYGLAGLNTYVESLVLPNSSGKKIECNISIMATVEKKRGQS